MDRQRCRNREEGREPSSADSSQLRMTRPWWKLHRAGERLGHGMGKSMISQLLMKEQWIEKKQFSNYVIYTSVITFFVALTKCLRETI